jgi:hypothetical protein
MTRDHDVNDGLDRLHRECWEQIPWIANGSLDAHERARLEPHLRACGACQEELALHERTRTLMRRDDPVMMAPQAGWQKLIQRIDAAVADVEEGVDVQPAPAERSRPLRWPRWAAIAASVQAVALALIFGAQYLDEREAAFTAPRYETLTAVSPVAASGPVIRLVFHTGVALQDVNALLRTVDAQVVAGPSEAGVYTIALKERRATPDIDAALVRLRADPRVLFAEAALARSTQ